MSLLKGYREVTAKARRARHTEHLQGNPWRCGPQAPPRPPSQHQSLKARWTFQCVKLCMKLPRNFALSLSLLPPLRQHNVGSGEGRASRPQGLGGREKEAAAFLPGNAHRHSRGPGHGAADGKVLTGEGRAGPGVGHGLCWAGPHRPSAEQSLLAIVPLHFSFGGEEIFVYFPWFVTCSS